MNQPSKKIVWVYADDVRVARSMAALKGLSLAEYFAQKVQQDSEHLEEDFRAAKQKKNGRRNFDSPF